MPTIHSKLGASSSERWLECPGSIKLSEDQPNKTSKYAAEGTAAHAVGEWSLNNNKPPKELLGCYVDNTERIFDDEDAAAGANQGEDEYYFEVTDEMVAAVTVYYDYVRRLIDDFEMADFEPELFVEQGFDLSFILPGMFGTNDASIFVKGRELVVVDYKHGAGKKVEVEENTQLLYYALGALRQVAYTEQGGVWDWDEQLTPSTVRIVVVQPRCNHPNGPVREWVTTPEYIINDFAEKLKEGAEATQRPNAEFRAGSWCQFCPAKTICEEFKAEFMTPIDLAFDDTDFDDLAEFVDDKKAAEAEGKRRGLEFSNEYPERLADVISVKQMVMSFFEAVEHAAMSRAQSGEKVPGFKLVRGTSRRRWKDEAKARQVLEMALDEEEIYSIKLKSPAAMERLGFTATINGLWEKPEGRLTIAPESDKRDEVVFFPPDLLEEDLNGT